MHNGTKGLQLENRKMVDELLVSITTAMMLALYILFNNPWNATLIVS